MDLATRFREGRRRGLSEREVGNLVAVELGLPVLPCSWTLRELRHLLFVRWLYERSPTFHPSAIAMNAGHEPG